MIVSKAGLYKKGVHTVNPPCGCSNVLIISDSGLFFTLRDDKKEVHNMHTPGR